MDSRTVAKYLRARELPSEGLSTSQVFSAMFGDIDSEKLRLTKEQADKLERENREAEGKLINVVTLAQNLQRFLSAARQRILSNIKLDEEEKDKILIELGQCLASADKPTTPDVQPAAPLHRKRVV
jgi:phage terminase Nu1 subunit (DNA packaging protein)